MLSVIVLTKNSEITLADCIGNVKSIAGEVIVVDSGSTDRTIEVAKISGATVIEHTFDNFSDQRNFAFKHTKGKWVLYLDSDEFVTKRFCAEVKRIMDDYNPNSDIGGYYLKRKTYYLGKDWGLTDQVQRLFIKDKFIEWHGTVHETPDIHGKFGHIESPVHHFTHQNLSQMLTKTIEWSEHEAQLRFDAKHPVMTPLRLFRVMATGFFDSYIKGKGYKNGTEGFIEAIYQSYSMFVTYAKLWEKQSKN